MRRSRRAEDGAARWARRLWEAEAWLGSYEGIAAGESKAVMGASMADPQQRECIRSAKHLAGFAPQGTAPVTSIQIENRRFAYFLEACSSPCPSGRGMAFAGTESLNSPCITRLASCPSRN